MKKDKRYLKIGSRARASARYAMIKNRLNNTHLSKNKNYSNIKLLISRENFIQWFMENDYLGCSVDRINTAGHYEASNLQLISLADNIRKDKTKAKNGMCECYVCKENKSVEVFARDKRRTNGHSTICKACDNARGRSTGL